MCSLMIFMLKHTADTHAQIKPLLFILQLSSGVCAYACIPGWLAGWLVCLCFLLLWHMKRSKMSYLLQFFFCVWVCVWWHCHCHCRSFIVDFYIFSLIARLLVLNILFFIRIQRCVWCEKKKTKNLVALKHVCGVRRSIVCNICNMYLK